MKKILFSLSIIWVTCWQMMGARVSVYSLEDSNNNHTLSRVLLQTGTETLFGADFIINHDADLGVSSVKSSDSVFVSNTSVPGQIKLAIANATGITGDKILVEVKFDKIISDSAISVSNVSLNEGGITSLGAVDTGVFDRDGDGVLDFDEEEIFNTDPDSKDTDGDGCGDRFEVENSADPNNAASFPTRTLTAENTTNGSITSTETHKLGATTTVTAVPALGYLFTAWTGVSSGANNPLTLTMDGDKTIGVTFTKDTADTDSDGFSNYDELVTFSTNPEDNTSYPTRTLTAVAVTNGSITSTETHKLGATTTVTAVPALGYLFTAWTGVSSGTNNPLTLTMDGNKMIGATFTKDTADTDGDGFSNYDELVTHKTDPSDASSYPTRKLTAVAATNGSITSTETHKLGATTTVTATPNLGYVFTAWTGASSGTNNPLTLTMDGNKTIGAAFAKDTADTDGDGFSNYDELVIHETDPADANSYPGKTLDLNLNISRSGNAIILEWKNGKLQKSLNLEQGFINVTDEDGDPVTSPYQIEITNKREFFRVSE